MPTSPSRPINPTVHLPEEGSYYYRTFWGAYKGHVMGMIRGTLIGGVLGGLIGLAFMGLMVTAGVAAGAMLLPGAALIAATGAMMGGGALGDAGYASGAAAAAVSEEELRLRYPGSGDGIAASRTSPTPGDGHHYEVPRDRDHGKWFHFSLGLPMAVVGIAVGALFAAAIIGGALPVLPLLAEMHLAAEGAAIAAPHILAGLTFVGGALGMSYGVDRARFKDLFNHTDAWVEGKLLRTTRESNAPMYDGMEQELSPRAEAGKARQVISTLERQEEAHRLYYDYFERSFWGSVGGNFKGFAGGPVIGAILGAVVGAAAFLVPPLAPFAPAIMALLAAEGAHEGLHIFTRAGMEAGAQSAARETLEVKRQRIQQGLDPEQEPAKEKEAWFKPKVALLGAVVGVVLGAVMAPLMAPMLMGALGTSTLMAGVPALLGPIAGALGAGTTLSLLACGTMGGLVGTLFGVGHPVTENIAYVADAVYDGRILQGDISHHREPCKVVYLSPESPWMPKASDMQKLAQERMVTIPSPEYTVIRTAPSAATAKTEGQSNHEAYPTSGPMQERLKQIIAERNPTTRSATQRLADQRELAAATDLVQI